MVFPADIGISESQIIEVNMLDDKGFDLWADGYDKDVGISDDYNEYPFAGYKNILGSIYSIIMSKPNAAVLDIGFGTGTLTAKLYENGCTIYGQDFSSRMIELAPPGLVLSAAEYQSFYAFSAISIVLGFVQNIIHSGIRY